MVEPLPNLDNEESDSGLVYYMLRMTSCEKYNFDAYKSLFQGRVYFLNM